MKSDTFIRKTLEAKTVDELVSAARDLNTKNYTGLNKSKLIDKLLQLDAKRLSEYFGLTWWHRHKNAIFAWSGLAGIVFTIVFGILPLIQDRSVILGVDDISVTESFEASDFIDKYVVPKIAFTIHNNSLVKARVKRIEILVQKSWRFGAVGLSGPLRIGRETLTLDPYKSGPYTSTLGRKYVLDEGDFYGMEIEVDGLPDARSACIYYLSVIVVYGNDQSIETGQFAILNGNYSNVEAVLQQRRDDATKLNSEMIVQLDEIVEVLNSNDLKISSSLKSLFN